MDQRDLKNKHTQSPEDHHKEERASADFAGDFFAWMDDWAQRVNLPPHECVAVAVSGGADSMALGHLMWRWAQDQGREIVAYTVDHGLRAEAAAEARGVAEMFAGLEGASHITLVWTHKQGSPQSRVQELAREARYALMASDMRDRGLRYLFTAHHQGDQAETFLFRLAKGSGLDGLSGMAVEQDFTDGLRLCRPLLGTAKEDLIAYCADTGLAFFHDPSNDQNRYSRVRLRRSMTALAEEGLSEKRLAKTASRMARARHALDVIAKSTYNSVTLKNETGEIVLDFKTLKQQPEEIILRIILMAIDTIGASGKYGVRMERAETLAHDLMKPFAFRKRTLGGVVFERDDKQGRLILMREA